MAFLPQPIQQLARLFPTYYSIDALREALFYARLTATGRDLACLAIGVGVAVTAAVLLLRTSRSKDKAPAHRSVPQLAPQ